MREVKIKLRTKQEYEGESCSLDGCPLLNFGKDICNLYDEEDLLHKRKCTSPPVWCEVRKHGVVMITAAEKLLVRIKME